MNDFDLAIPVLLSLGGTLLMVAYVLAIAVRDMSRQLTKMNEELLLAWKSATGDAGASRGLVAKAMQSHVPPAGKPKKLEGVAEKKEEKPKPALTMTMGGI